MFEPDTEEEDREFMRADANFLALWPEVTLYATPDGEIILDDSACYE